MRPEHLSLLLKGCCQLKEKLKAIYNIRFLAVGKIHSRIIGTIACRSLGRQLGLKGTAMFWSRLEGTVFPCFKHFRSKISTKLEFKNAHPLKSQNLFEVGFPVR